MSLIAHIPVIYKQMEYCLFVLHFIPIPNRDCIFIENHHVTDMRLRKGSYTIDHSNINKYMNPSDSYPELMSG